MANTDELSGFQYTWNANEMYLFKANVAYALRQLYSERNENLPFT